MKLNILMKINQIVENDKALGRSMLAGGLAGLTVDMALFPLDTVKTRLQSQFGFWRSGGFRGIYKGVWPTALGSAPAGSLFFLSYNTFKNTVHSYVENNEDFEFPVQMAAAGIGEITSCFVRVPTEIVKQRRQAWVNDHSAMEILRSILKLEGVAGMYRGFWTTVLRDVPYTILQIPLWEFFKTKFKIANRSSEVTTFQGALCGSLSGGIAGIFFAPFDLVKTRIVLSSGDYRGAVKLRPIVSKIYKENGPLGFFAGFFPRILWILLGEGIFFGVYEKTWRSLNSI